MTFLDMDDILSDLEPLEPGIYNATIAKAEVRKSKKGEEYVSITFAIKGQYVYLNLFLWSESEGAKLRGRRMLKDICSAAGLPTTGKMSLDSLVGKKVDVAVRNFNGSLEVSSIISEGVGGL